MQVVTVAQMEKPSAEPEVSEAICSFDKHRAK